MRIRACCARVRHTPREMSSDIRPRDDRIFALRCAIAVPQGGPLCRHR